MPFNISTVSPAEAGTIVECCIPHTKKPFFLWGAYGVGKSSIVRSIVASLSEQNGEQFGFIDIRLSQFDAVDTRGIPTEDDGKTKWLLPDVWPDVERDGRRGILFLDELLHATPSVQSAAYQLTNDRILGDYVLPDGWTVIAASNRPEDNAGVHGRTDAALANRFATHLNITPSVDEWIEWAKAADVNPYVIAFISWRGAPTAETQGLLHEYPNGGAPKGHIAIATPRSWENASAILNAGLPANLEQAALEGCVGQGAAAELSAFVRVIRDLPSFEDILRDPQSVPSPDDLSTRYAIVAQLAAKVDHSTVNNAVSWISGVDNELVAVFFQLADAGLKSSQAYIDYKVANQHTAI